MGPLSGTSIQSFQGIRYVNMGCARAKRRVTHVFLVQLCRQLCPVIGCGIQLLLHLYFPHSGSSAACPTRDNMRAEADPKTSYLMCPHTMIFERFAMNFIKMYSILAKFIEIYSILLNLTSAEVCSSIRLVTKDIIILIK